MATAASICYRREVKLTRTEAGYVVEVPDDVVALLGLHEGDLVTLGRLESNPADDVADQASPVDIFQQMARPLPAGYKFDREEANAR